MELWIALRLGRECHCPRLPRRACLIASQPFTCSAPPPPPPSPPPLRLPLRAVQAYSDKADIWSLGCILYEAAMLVAPFAGANPLVVASRIVEGSYPPLDGQFSPMLHDVVARCLTVRQEQRPDADGISRLIAPRLLAAIDAASADRAALSAELAVERERRAAAEREAARAKEAMHKIFSRSHALQQHAACGAGAGGAGGGFASGRGARSVSAAAGAAQIARPAGRGGAVDGAATPLSGGSSPALVRPQKLAADGGGGWSCGGGRGRGRGAGGGGGVCAATAAMAAASGSDGSGGEGNGSGSEGPPSYSGFAGLEPVVSLRAASGSALHRLRRSSIEGHAGSSEPPMASPLRRIASGGASSSSVGGRSGLLSISPHRVREISDPASLLLNQLHKVLFIDQLPPSLTQNHVRRFARPARRACDPPLSSQRLLACCRLVPPLTCVAVCLCAASAQPRHRCDRFGGESRRGLRAARAMSSRVLRPPSSCPSPP